MAEPTFGSPYLVCRFLDGVSEPSLPVKRDVSRVCKPAVFVGEDDNVLIKNDEEVANLFAVPSGLWFSLVSVNSGVTPQGHEGLATKPGEVFFRGGNASCLLDRLPFGSAFA